MGEKDNFRISIYDIIRQLEDLIEDSPKPAFGGSERRIVDVEAVRELISDMKVEIDEDIRKAVSVLTEADRIMDSAEEHAQSVTSSSEERAHNIVYEAKTDAADIISKAEAQAKRLIEDAEANAARITDEAIAEHERMINESTILAEARTRACALKEKAEMQSTELYNNAVIYADGIMSDVSKFLSMYQSQIRQSRAELGAKELPKPVQTSTEPETSIRAKRVISSDSATVEVKSAGHLSGKRPIQEKTGEYERVSTAFVHINEETDEPDDDVFETAAHSSKHQGFFRRIVEKLRGDEDDDYEEEYDDGENE